MRVRARVRVLKNSPFAHKRRLFGLSRVLSPLPPFDVSFLFIPIFSRAVERLLFLPENQRSESKGCAKERSEVGIDRKTVRFGSVRSFSLLLSFEFEACLGNVASKNDKK